PNSLSGLFSLFPFGGDRVSSNKRSLRAVAPDEVPAPVKPLTLADAIEAGDYLQILLAQRRELATERPSEERPAKAALPRQLSLLSKEIETLQRGEDEGAEGGRDVEDEEFDSAVI